MLPGKVMVEACAQIPHVSHDKIELEGIGGARGWSGTKTLGMSDTLGRPEQLRDIVKCQRIMLQLTA